MSASELQSQAEQPILKTVSYLAFEALTLWDGPDFTAMEVAQSFGEPDKASAVSGYVSRCLANESVGLSEKGKRGGWRVYDIIDAGGLAEARDVARYTRRTHGCASDPELPSKYAIADRLRAIADDLGRFPMSLADYSTPELMAELHRRIEATR